MSWQDGEIERRQRDVDEHNKRMAAVSRLSEIRELSERRFVDKLIAANQKLDPSLRLQIDPANVRFEFKSRKKWLRVWVRHDTREERLYLVEEEAIFLFDLFGGDPRQKRCDYHHYVLNDSNIDLFADLLLKNICTNRPLTEGFAPPDKTIKGSEKYREAVSLAKGLTPIR